MYKCEMEKELTKYSREGKVDKVKRLLRWGVNPNCYVFLNKHTKTTPLWCAAYKGHGDVAKLLLDAGADPDMANGSGLTPLHVATGMRTNDVVLCRILLEAGADPNKANRDGDTLLRKAHLQNQRDVIQLLLDHGADPRNIQGNTSGWLKPIGYP